ncbi:hypothetical protein B0H16DRAFT_1734438 [Mycena metata]|uniref:Uncharacterized protein n=1 Tax=Mycena metata TaxID=1033252 RepID=A0AAD7HUU8_9AGAR|nr:hypothetical protein B0H16DRAFT_1734438 [Mycena metata]
MFPVTLLALISGASAYLAAHNVGNLLSDQQLVPDVVPGQFRKIGRLEYSNKKQWYMSTDQTPRNLLDDVKATRPIYLNAEPDILQEEDLVTITVIDGGVQKTMGITKPTIQGEHPWGFERSVNNTVNTEDNTTYKFLVRARSCKQLAPNGLVVCPHHVCVPGPEPRTCLKAHLNGTLTFQTRFVVDRSFNWYPNVQGVSSPDWVLTGQEDFLAEHADDDRVNDDDLTDPDSGTCTPLASNNCTAATNGTAA